MTRLTPFGAFVDLGGIEGLVHISEISRSQVADPADFLAVGQEVAVQVLQIKTDEKNQERISLSMKVLEPDPWETGLGLDEGDIVLGKVRNLAQFGAFIELAPGIEGLVHIPEISYKRIRHPKELLKEGQEVEVKVQEINKDQRRISLSIKEVSPLPGLEIVLTEQEMVRTGNIIRRRVRLAANERSIIPTQDESNLSPDQSPPPQISLAPTGPKLPEVGMVVKGVIRSIKPYGFFIDLPELGSHQRGLLHKSELGAPETNQLKKGYKEGDDILVELIKIDEQGRISLSQKSIMETQDQADLNAYRDRAKENVKFGTLADLFKKKNGATG